MQQFSNQFSWLSSWLEFFLSSSLLHFFFSLDFVMARLMLLHTANELMVMMTMIRYGEERWDAEGWACFIARGFVGLISGLTNDHQHSLHAYGDRMWNRFKHGHQDDQRKKEWRSSTSHSFSLSSCRMLYCCRCSNGDNPDHHPHKILVCETQCIVYWKRISCSLCCGDRGSGWWLLTCPLLSRGSLDLIEIDSRAKQDHDEHVLSPVFFLLLWTPHPWIMIIFLLQSDAVLNIVAKM